MDLDSNGMVMDGKSQVLPDVEMYCFLLAQLLLIGMGKLHEAKAVSDEAFQRLKLHNRRTMDSIAAKVYFYFGLVYEKLNDMESIRP